MPFLLSLLLLPPAPGRASTTLPVVDHRLRVAAQPDAGTLRVEDRITLPAPVTALEFLLHAGLAPRLMQPAGRLSPLGPSRAQVPAMRYRLELDRPARSFRLEYGGRIRHPMSDDGRDRPSTPGTLSPDGIFLATSTLWYPWIEGHLLTFSLELELPAGWRGISQGKPLPSNAGWAESSPQDDLYLVAGPYQGYERQFAPAMAQVWLREPAQALAQRYLEATGHYLDLYEHLIGPYPYAKFALVENFWESGYGMPSFTLLGPRVIRLPFILHSAYPHEILHNWWGNSVYVDHATGNWAEGLTSYLADHLIREEQGRGAAYRRDLLLQYAHWVKEGRDIPLEKFRARHGEASQAAGYGRMLMFMHMLRLRLGDATFLRALRKFYRDNRFRIAGFDDLRTAFERVSKRDLKAEFGQWTRRTGAPALTLDSAEARRNPAGGYRIHGVLRQTQAEAPFRLRVPVWIQLEGVAEPRLEWLEMNSRELRFEIPVTARPLQLAVDPLFDLFRRLTPDETPPSLSALFSASEASLILPAAASAEERNAWKALARAWRQRQPRLKVLEDDRLERLPETGAVWVLGAGNRFAGQLLETAGVRRSEGRVRLDGRWHDLADHALVLVAGEKSPRGLIIAPAETIPALTRKLPHYGKYGWLLFDTEGRNRRKEQWPTASKALSARFVDDVPLPPLRPPPHPPLKQAAEAMSPAS